MTTIYQLLDYIGWWIVDSLTARAVRTGDKTKLEILNCKQHCLWRLNKIIMANKETFWLSTFDLMLFFKLSPRHHLLRAYFHFENQQTGCDWSWCNVLCCAHNFYVCKKLLFWWLVTRRLSDRVSCDILWNLFFLLSGIYDISGNSKNYNNDNNNNNKMIFDSHSFSFRHPNRMRCPLCSNRVQLVFVRGFCQEEIKKMATVIRPFVYFNNAFASFFRDLLFRLFLKVLRNLLIFV